MARLVAPGATGRQEIVVWQSSDESTSCAEYPRVSSEDPESGEAPSPTAIALRMGHSGDHCRFCLQQPRSATTAAEQAILQES